MKSIEPRKISSPGELVQVLQELKQSVAKGAIRQVDSAQSTLSGKIQIENIPTEGPWPDYIEMYFEDTNSRDIYRLTVETYHGAGGSWERV